MTLCMSVPPGPSPVLIKLHVGRVILAPVSFSGEITVRVGHTHLHDSLRGSLLFDWLIDLYNSSWCLRYQPAERPGYWANRRGRRTLRSALWQHFP